MMGRNVIQPYARLIILLVLIACYLGVIRPFADYMHRKPVVEKLGVFPRVEVFQFVAADQKQLVAASLVMKVMMYFGGLMDKEPGKYQIAPEYQTMSGVLHGAVRLDPYNMDAYYFAQAFLVWDVGAYKIANDLLDYGMRYRTWDWYLPFFAGFNSSYFLKDYASAARYYRKAADLSGDPLFASLASRYMQKTGQTELAIAYLTTMAKTARNQAIKKSYGTRLKALQGVRVIELARDCYLKKYGRLPASVEALTAEGCLERIPADPYGGRFYFEPDGSVATTSKFAFVSDTKGKTGVNQ